MRKPMRDSRGFARPELGEVGAGKAHRLVAAEDVAPLPIAGLLVVEGDPVHDFFLLRFSFLFLQASAVAIEISTHSFGHVEGQEGETSNSSGRQ